MPRLHERSGTRRIALASVLLVWSTPAAAAPEAPFTACPGAVDEVALALEAPLFSWSRVAGAAAYELVVLPIPVAGEELVDPVVSRRIAGAATTWTPSAEGALPAGGAYAWYVRAVVADGEEGEVAGEWSRGRLFRTPPPPARAEAEAALRVLAEHVVAVEGGSIGAGAPQTVAADTPATAGARGAARAPRRAASPALTTTGAALSARVGDTSGAASGAVGVTHSSDGAGIVAANLAGGADLMLGVDPAQLRDLGHLLSEVQGDLVLASMAGAELEVADGQALVVTNGGTPLLRADLGGLAADSFSGDGSQLTGVVATGLSCSGCLTGLDIADAVTGADILNGSLFGANVAGLTGTNIGLLTGTDIADGTITANELAASSVGTTQLANDSVGAAEIVTGGVGTAEIFDASVRGVDLAPIWAVKVECNGECTDSTLGNICALVPGSRPIGVTCSEVDPFGPGGTCGGDNQCLTLQLTASTVLADYCEDVFGVDALVFCLDD